MVADAKSFDTQHEDMIHDAQFDYYGKRLATCSSDRVIKVFFVPDDQQAQNQLLAELKGHEGPVWQLAWAHPKFGSILASCSYDRKVIIWKELAQNQWEKVKVQTFASSVNSLSFAPHEFSLKLVCACSDGNVHVLAHKPDTQDWHLWSKKAHDNGCNAVAWAPAFATEKLLKTGGPLLPNEQRFASGGSDNSVKVWRFNETTHDFSEETVGGSSASKHTDWVRDVAWAPSSVHPMLATCSQDKTVRIWTERDRKWESVQLRPAHNSLTFSSVPWRLSWSVSGNILAVSAADSTVTLWKQQLNGDWQCIQNIQDEPAQAQQ